MARVEKQSTAEGGRGSPHSISTNDRRGMIRTGLVALVVSCLISLTLGPTRVFAYSCNITRPSNTNVAYQAGAAVTPSPYPDGVFAVIDEKDAKFNHNATLGPLMSVMLDDYTTMWGQLGWMYHKYPSGSVAREIFVEHVDGFGNNNFFFWTGKAIGSTTSYEITYAASNGRFNYYVNGSNYAGLNTNTSHRPARWEIFGETHDAADQTPGGTSTHARFRNDEVMLSNSMAWITASGGIHYVGGNVNGASGSAGSIDIWDAECTS